VQSVIYISTMKGTAMTLVVGGTLELSSARTCNFETPSFGVWTPNPAFEGLSCELSDTCCSGLQDLEHLAAFVKGGGKPQGAKGEVMQDLIGTCGRADQVELYNCAAENLPKMAPVGKGAKTRALIQAKGCHSVQAHTGPDGDGHCSLSKGKGKGTLEIDGVSMGCCAAGNNFIAAAQDVQTRTEVTPGQTTYITEPKEPQFKDAACGMIGACGKEDQKSIVRFAKGMMKGGGPPAELNLLEMFNMTNVAPQEMLATILTSEAEDEVIEDEDDASEDDATADGSPIVPGLLGFMAGATVTGLGVTVLRRSALSSQDQYNEIVA